MEQQRNLSLQTVFLIDGVGAFVSAVMLGFVLTTFESFFGMPAKVLYILSAIAFLFAVYSFINAARKNCTACNLKLIALANLLYCALTFVLMLTNFQQISKYGLLYFTGEIIIIVSLALFELSTAATKR